MKITGIDIGEYRQFKNINFDFTYPEGHSKAGQPLEKVCFIGQSGTGKTTLLKIIEEYFKIINSGLTIQRYIADKHKRNIQLHRDDSGSMFYEYIQNIRIISTFNNNSITFDRYEKSNISERGGEVLKWLSDSGFTYENEDNSRLCLYIPDYISLGADLLLNPRDEQRKNNNFIKSQQQLDEESEILTKQIQQLDLAKTISLSDINYDILWYYILKDVNIYDQKVKTIAVELIQNSSSFSAEKLFKKLADWKAANSNPRHELAQKCVNPIINRFHLEMDVDNTETPIVLKNRQNTVIPNKYLSTGTKQLLTTAIPIYKLVSSSTVVLFDEPERSLFPDIQRNLINYYVSLAPEAQFFFATHSPIIAAAFEPCERFILYFDENGEVKFRNGVAPIGDDPNDVLRSDFGLSELMLDEGLAAYDRYRKLFVEIKNEKDSVRKKELMVEQAKLGDKYKF
jgi:ABC-type polar amino acid transport system ATPase subunit